ncbi:MAG: hypothetical protein R3200_01960 [Xanthomonadales bacterium]|nr:hypothetical protein [Xanthomonadales bacterium]
MKKTILTLLAALFLSLAGTGIAQAHGYDGHGKHYDRYGDRHYRDYRHDYRRYGHRSRHDRRNHRGYYGYRHRPFYRPHRHGYRDHHHRYRPVLRLNRHHHGYRYCEHHGGYFRSGDFYFGFRY